MTPSSPAKQTLDEIRARHIADHGPEDWEMLVHEQEIRTTCSSHKGMTEMLMDTLVLNVANARFDKYAGYEGHDIAFEIFSITEDGSTEGELLCSLCREAPAVSTACMIPGPLTLSMNPPDAIKRMACSFGYFLWQKHADMDGNEMGDYLHENRIHEYFMELRRERI